jgi:(p)ppGpp synthase/HD superfamily hydrolase
MKGECRAGWLVKSPSSRHDSGMPTLTPTFLDALVYAAELHADQTRKGSDVPYLAHLLAVGALVIEDGGSEAEAIAAVLHDAVEDQGGEPVAQEIERRFGLEVASIVRAATDTDQLVKPPWRERKERHLATLLTATPQACRVIAADKLHNVRSLIGDYRVLGEELWSRFRGGREGTLWYYRRAAELLRERLETGLTAELMHAVERLEALVGARQEAK